MAIGTAQFVLVCIVGLVAAQKSVDPPTIPTAAARVNLSPVDGAYKGTVSVEGKDYNLHLKHPVESVFASNFKFLVADTDADGSIQMKEHPISMEKLEMSERSLFVDEKTNAVFRVKHVMGEVRLHGHLQDMHISHDGENHIARIHNVTANTAGFRDYVDMNRTIVPDARIQTRHGTTWSEPELLFVMDYHRWTSLDKDAHQAADYLAMYTRTMNNRYATNSDPKIHFKIVSALANNERSAQPYLEDHKAGDGSDTYQWDGVLWDFSQYMYKYREYFEAHDMAPLMTGAGFKYQDDDGEWYYGSTGVAWVGTACSISDYWEASWQTSVTWDYGYPWGGGLYTMVHELAHNLNAPHDGGGDAESCPWDDGYLMSYVGVGKLNKLRFSSCSQKIMKEFIDSEYGQCLRETNAGGSAWADSGEDLGDRYSLDQQCQMHSGRSDAQRSSRDNDEICQNLSCGYWDRCSNESDDQCWWTVWYNTIPYDRSPCDDNGNRCINGYCTSD